MINEFTDISCPADCSTPVLLGAIAEDQSCVTVPDYSQVRDLLITPDGAPQPIDWTAAPAVTYVADSIDNTEALGAKSKHLVGQGGVAEPELREVEMPDRAIVVASRTYTLTFRVSITEQAVYDMLRQMQCGWKDFTFQYANVGDHVFGDETGISPLKVDVKFPLGEGRDDTEIGIIEIQFETKNGDPRRGNWPL